MSKNIWDKEERTLFRKYLREYKREGFDDREAKRLARQDVREVMVHKIDFAEDLYETKLDEYN